MRSLNKTAALLIQTVFVLAACGGVSAPSAPTNFRMYDHEYTVIRLSWDAPTGASVASYELQRDGVAIAGPAAGDASTSDFGLTENTSYTYRLRACDTSKNCSAWASTTATTANDPANDVDNQAPSKPTGLAKSGATATSITLSWSASTDNVGVTGYEVRRGGSSIGVTNAATRTFTENNLSANTEYSYTVRARDAAGNWSSESSALVIRTSTVSDTQAPTVPGGLSKTGSSANSISLSWSASTDNLGVTGYEVFRGANSVGTTNALTLSFTDTGLAASTNYSYQVRARDAAGNWSAKSSPLNVSTTAAGSLNPPHSTNVPSGYRLVWQDEFEADGLPDASKWVYDDWGNVDGWGNQELQYYSVADLDNTHVSAGKLYITARKETITSRTGHVFNYTSARLMTEGVVDWNYGYFEVRAKMPCGAGTWPAIWMLGSNSWWPEGGEIDILEHFQGTNTQAAANVHWAESGVHKEVSPQYQDVSTICTDFHNYWLKWTPIEIVIGVDQNTTMTVPKQRIAEGRWPFDNRQYLLLNLAIGGFGGGPVDDSIFPRSMVIDYVRVYQQQ